MMLLQIYVKDETLKEKIVEGIEGFMRYHDENIIDEFLEQAGVSDFNVLAEKLLDDEDFVRDYRLQMLLNCIQQLVEEMRHSGFNVALDIKLV